MALVLRALYDGYHKYYYDAQDSRTTDLFLMNPPWMPFAIVGVYLYFVFNLGPKLMAPRQPFQLRTGLLVYNFLQVAANVYLACVGYTVWLKKPLPIMCRPNDSSYSAQVMLEIKLGHYYYLLKLVDLLDTVFFVLRKKKSQITFLHVYHHAAVVFGSCFYTRQHPVGHGAIIGFLNVHVHVLVYLYFFASVLQPEWTRTTRFKKYLTIAQMVQFIALAFSFGYPLVVDYGCDVSKFWLFSVFVQSVFMFLMFADFYVKAYRVKKVK